MKAICLFLLSIKSLNELIFVIYYLNLYVFYQGIEFLTKD